MMSILVKELEVEKEVVADASATRISEFTNYVDLPVRVLSYNLNILPPGCGGYQQERIDTFLGTVHNYDVLLLQEVYALNIIPKALQHLCCYQAKLINGLKAKGFNYYVLAESSWCETLFRNRVLCDSGLLIASRFPICHRAFYAFDKSAAEDREVQSSGAPKGCLMAEIAIPLNAYGPHDNIKTEKYKNKADGEANDVDDENDLDSKKIARLVLFNVHMWPEEKLTINNNKSAQSNTTSNNISNLFGSHKGKGTKTQIDELCQFVNTVQKEMALLNSRTETQMHQLRQIDQFDKTYRVNTINVAGDNAIANTNNCNCNSKTTSDDTVSKNMKSNNVINTHIVIAGDFNIPGIKVSNKHSTKHINDVFVKLQSLAHLHDVLYTSNNYHHVPTQPATLFFPTQTKLENYNAQPQRHDYFFVNLSLKTTNVQLEKFVVGHSRPYTYLSNHFGITATLHLPVMQEANDFVDHSKCTAVMTKEALLSTSSTSSTSTDKNAVCSELEKTDDAAAIRDGTSKKECKKEKLKMINSRENTLKDSKNKSCLLYCWWLKMVLNHKTMLFVPFLAISFALLNMLYLPLYAVVLLCSLLALLYKISFTVLPEPLLHTRLGATRGNNSSSTSVVKWPMEKINETNSFAALYQKRFDVQTRINHSVWEMTMHGTVKSYTTKDIQEEVLKIQDLFARTKIRNGEVIAVEADACLHLLCIDLLCLEYNYTTLPVAGKSSTVRSLLDQNKIRVAIADQNSLNSLLHCRSTSLETIICLHKQIDDEDVAAAKDLNIHLIPLSTNMFAINGSKRWKNIERNIYVSNIYEWLRLGNNNVFTYTIDNVANTDDVTLIPYTQREILRQIQLLQTTHILRGKSTSKEILLWSGPFALLFHRICALAAWICSNDVVIAPVSQLQRSLSIFKPTLLIASPAQFTSSKVQLRRARRRYSKWYNWCLEKAYALSSRLIFDYNIDLRLLRYCFFGSLYRQLGGNVRSVILAVSEESTAFKLIEYISVCFTPCVREVSFQSRVGVCTVDKIPVPTIKIQLDSFNNVLTDAGIYQLNVLCSDFNNFNSNCPVVRIDAGIRYVHCVNCVHINIINRKNNNCIDANHESNNFSCIGSSNESDCNHRNGIVSLPIAARWECNETLTLLGTLSGILWPVKDHYVIAAELERLYATSRYVCDVFVYCAPSKPLIAVVYPNRDTVEYEWRNTINYTTHNRHFNSSGSSSNSNESKNNNTRSNHTSSSSSHVFTWDELVSYATSLIQHHFAEIAHEEQFPMWMIPEFVHLHPHAFRHHTTFVTPFGKLRREVLYKYFARVFDNLYSSTNDNENDGENSYDDVQKQETEHEHNEQNFTGMANFKEVNKTSSTVTTAALNALESDNESIGSWQNVHSISVSNSLHTWPVSHDQEHSSPQNCASYSLHSLELKMPVTVDIGGTFAKFAFITPPGVRQLVCYHNLQHEASSLSACIGIRTFRFFQEEQAAMSELQQNPHSSVGVLSFARIPTSRIIEFVSYIAEQHLMSKYKPEYMSKIRVTGGGAFKYSALAKETLNVSFDVVKEMDAVVKGLNLIIQIAQNSIFTVEPNTATHLPHRLYDKFGNFAPFPYLIINIGSGISFIKCTGADGSHVRVGGSPIGGATFWGLTRTMTNLTSWDEVVEIMRLDGPGDNKNVDLLVGDIYGFNARDLPAMLSAETVASSFGKFGTQRLNGASITSPTDHFADDGTAELTSPVASYVNTTPMTTISLSSTNTSTTTLHAPVTTKAASTRAVAFCKNNNRTNKSSSVNNTTVTTSMVNNGDVNNNTYNNDDNNDDCNVDDDDDDDDTEYCLHEADITGNCHKNERKIIRKNKKSVKEFNNNSVSYSNNNNNNTSTSANISTNNSFAANYIPHYVASLHNTNSSNNHRASSIDIVRSLLNMIAGNVTQLAYLHGKIHGVNNIFFTGGFVRENAIMCSLISNYMQYWSSGECHPHFLEHDGYLGVLGCAVTDLRLNETQPESQSQLSSTN